MRKMGMAQNDFIEYLFHTLANWLDGGVFDNLYIYFLTSVINKQLMPYIVKNPKVEYKNLLRSLLKEPNWFNAGNKKEPENNMLVTNKRMRLAVIANYEKLLKEKFSNP